MKSIEIYLVTNGVGAQAIEFYKEALNATVTSVTTFGQGWPECPEEFKHLIMNAQFDVDGIRFQLSDENPMFEYTAGKNISATLIFDNLAEATTVYNKLTVDANEILMPLQEVPWSPGYAGFIDQFGIYWQINTELASN